MERKILVRTHYEKETKLFFQKYQKYNGTIQDVKKNLEALNFQVEFYENLHQLYKIIQPLNLQEIRQYEKFLMIAWFSFFFKYFLSQDFDANCLFYEFFFIF
jgi:hypothetical protein